MRLSCSDYTWPLLPHAAVLDLVAAMGFPAVDIGFMTNRSHVRPELVAAAPVVAARQLAAELERRNLAVADVFAIPAEDFASASLNNPDPAEQARSLEFFRTALAFAEALGSPGLTTLPGTEFPGDSFSGALERSARGLRQRVEMAGERGLAVSVEAHVGSLVPSVDKARELLDAVPGLTLTLDYGHLVCLGEDQARVHELLPSARHLQCRAAQVGQLQVPVVDDLIDFDDVVARLAAQAYSGYLAVEYTWQEWMGCNRVDTIAETVQMKDRLQAAIGRSASAR